MRRSRVSLTAAGLSLPSLLLVLAGCAVTVDQTDLEDEIGRGEDGVTAVSCDGGLEGAIGSTQDCTVTLDDDSTFELLVTVTDVDGSEVVFDYAIADPSADE